jgi:AbrB family looped-hinge helix DNA binding protein
MKIGERGQVTIPKKWRERLGLKPATEVEFVIEADRLVLKKAVQPLRLRQWKGKCRGALRKMGYKSVDEYIRDVRGR